MKRILLACSILLLSTPSFAISPRAVSQCRDSMLNMNNLQGSIFAERPAIIDSANTLITNANGDAYQLSLPLMIGATLGETNLYNQALSKIYAGLQAPELASTKKNTYKAWLYGRILMAAKSMNDTKTASFATRQLHIILNDPASPVDNYATWAWGYLASYDGDAYTASLPNLLAAAQKLTANYVQINKGNDSADKKQSARSDAIWAWVLIAQAAANANDQDTYLNALNEMETISGQSTVAEALSKGLLHTPASNDYPAWAMAMTQASALVIVDRKLNADLAQPLTKAIADATAAQATAEKLIAQSIAEFTDERNTLLLACLAKKAYSKADKKIPKEAMSDSFKN